MNPEIVRAPPTRVVLARLGFWIAAGALLVALGKLFLFPWLRSYLQSGIDPAEGMRRFKAVMFGFGVAVFLPAVHACRLGVRVLRQGQWPLAGSFVLRDTPVRRGRAVCARGYLFIVLGVILGLDAVCLALVPYFLER
jgi:hypothetical protein